MDAEMASWKSTGTYVDEVPPPGVNIISGMWIFRVLLHVADQRDYELHSLDFSTAFLQGSLHEEIWLRRPPGFIGSIPAGTQWSLRQPVYSLRQAPREWHDTLRTTLASLGFAPSTADPSLFLRTDNTLQPFYVLVYVDDLVFATADTEALAHVKSELQKRHTCTDLGELTSYLGLRITRHGAQRTITLTQSHMVQQVLQRFGFTYSSPQSTPLPTGHSLSAPPSDESVEPSGPYPELVGCLMYLMTCTRPDLAYPLSLLARDVAPGRHRKVHWDAAKRVLRYLCSTSGMGLVLGGRARVVLTGHADASWVDDLATQRSSQGYTFSLGSGSVSWRSTRSSSVLSSSCEAEIYAGAMAAQELRWLTYLLTDLGEVPRSPPVLYVDNKAMLALCQEHRLEHRTKHIALRYFLARELQQRGQLRLAYVASQANTADVFTKALQPCVHQPCFAFLTGLVTPCSPPLCLWGSSCIPQFSHSAGTRGASLGGVGAGGLGTGGASSGGVGAGGAGTGGASSGGVGAGGAGIGGSSSGGVGGGGTGAGGARTGDARGAGAFGAGEAAVLTAGPVGGAGAAAVATAKAEAEAAAVATTTAAATAAAIATAARGHTSEWPSGPWSSLPSSCPPAATTHLRSYVSSSGLDSSCFPSSSVTVSSSRYPARLDRSLSPACSSLVSSCRPPHCLVSFQSSFTPPEYVLPSPPASSLTVSSHPITDYYRTGCPVVSRILASLVTDPRASPSSVSALTAAVTDFATTRRLDFATRVMAASPAHPEAVGGGFALGYDVLEDRQFELEFLAAASPSLCAMLISSEGDPDALDIPSPCTYREAVSGKWASQWKAAMDSELASWRSTGTYVDAVPPPRANVVDGMWLFNVKRPPGSLPVFKMRYVARGFSQREGVDFFQTFTPTLKITTLQVLLHWSLRWPVYGLRQLPREWHDTLRSTLRDLGFRPSSADPSLFVCTGSTPFLILVYVLRRFGFQFSTTRPTPLVVDHRLTSPFPDEPFESSGPYAELVGCLMYLMTCTQPDLTSPLSVLSRFVATGRHHPVHWTAAVRVAKYLATTSGMGLVLGGTQPVELTGHCDSSYTDDAETLRSTQGYCFSLGAGAVSWRSTRSSSVASSSAEAKIYAGAMAAQELRWLTFLLADLGERPRSAPTLYADNKAMTLLCQEPQLERRVKHIDVRYFLVRELQRRSQARLDFVASEANTTLLTSSPRPWPLVTTTGFACS
ncbi:unnamed protein product [Closterium sp. NIES-53]